MYSRVVLKAEQKGKYDPCNFFFFANCVLFGRFPFTFRPITKKKGNPFKVRESLEKRFGVAAVPVSKGSGSCIGPVQV